jgi:hypothetical protein
MQVLICSYVEWTATNFRNSLKSYLPRNNARSGEILKIYSHPHQH